MKFTQLLPVIAALLAIQFSPCSISAQTNAPGSNDAVAVPEVHTNMAIIPVPRTGGITNRQSLVLQRAKDAPGEYDIEFIGDSITQGWEGGGKNVWAEFYGSRKCINMGVSGDRTEHVLWRFDQGQLEGIKAKVAVVMIGTNNSCKNKDGTDIYTDSDILEGVTAIVNQIRARQPDTKILLLGIFPRPKTSAPSVAVCCRSTKRSPGWMTASAFSIWTSARS